MKLIEALKRLTAIHLQGEVSYERLPSGQQVAGLPDLHRLLTVISTSGPFPRVGRHESAKMTQDLIDDGEALELFLVSELQRTLEVILKQDSGIHSGVLQYWDGWLAEYRTEAETLRKDMNL